jgi:hypothetical protein
MPNWIIALITPLIEKFAAKIGKLITDWIKGSIKESKRIKDLEAIKDPQAKAAYVKSMLNR